MSLFPQILPSIIYLTCIPLLTLGHPIYVDCGTDHFPCLPCLCLSSLILGNSIKHDYFFFMWKPCMLSSWLAYWQSCPHLWISLLFLFLFWLGVHTQQCSEVNSWFSTQKSLLVGCRDNWDCPCWRSNHVGCIQVKLLTPCIICLASSELICIISFVVCFKIQHHFIATCLIVNLSLWTHDGYLILYLFSTFLAQNMDQRRS